MRLGRTSRWILTLGILAMLLGTAGFMYMREQDEQERLRAQLDQAQETLQKYTTANITGLRERRQELWDDLEETQSRPIELTPRFRDYPESIEINRAVFRTADQADVTIMSLSSSQPESVDLRGITYRAFKLQVKAGAVVLPELIDFCMKLDDTFDTMKLESADVSVSGDTATLDLTFTVYYLGEGWPG